VWTRVSAGYFETFKIPVVRGRTIYGADESGPPVVIINQTLAKDFWPNSDPLNDQIIIYHDSPRQIIGVVGDVHAYSLNRDPLPSMYVSDIGCRRSSHRPG